ncbi:MAG: imidazole glycerol phosphate synthase subunit HisH [Deltaproteobacteria bacterium]|nr:imidazole glycerol phosphate synthase subunit HisH [Deltaproteobacteria bacterium]
MLVISIIDYGMGNLRSVHKAFEHLGVKAEVTRDPKKILNAQKIVLPGVGAFRDCMKNLQELDLIDPILKSIQSGKPFFGICLGMQLLLTESEEFGKHEGLNIIPGKVVRFSEKSEKKKSENEKLKIPQIGWNQIQKKKETPLLKEIPDQSYFYFVHSYYVVPKDSKVVATTTDYGIEFASSLQKDNIFATQFHPEKSQELGLNLLKAFAKLKD